MDVLDVHSGLGVCAFWQDGQTVHLTGTIIEAEDIQYRKSDDVPYKVGLGRGRSRQTQTNVN